VPRVLLRASRALSASGPLPLARAAAVEAPRWAAAPWPRANALCSSSSATIDEAAQALVITERCAKRILQLNRKQGLDDPTVQRLLRLSVEPGGCSGFSYKFELEDRNKVEAEDAIFEQSGARVVVDDVSLALLAGATIDFEDEMMRSAFVVAENPQAGAGCGCGTSFSPANF